MTTTGTTSGLVPYPEEFAERYRRAGVWGELTIDEELRRTADLVPDAVAVVGGDERLTYRELDTAVDVFAVALRRLGLGPGDPVVFQLANEPSTVVAYYASLRAGLIPICSLAQHRAAEIGYLIEHTGARAHFVQKVFRDYDLPGFARQMAGEHRSITTGIVFGGQAPAGMHAYTDLVAGIDPAAARAETTSWARDPESIAAFQLSGGTTGVPKVIPRLHCEYAYNSRAWARTWGWDTTTVMLHAGPMMHNAGIAAAVQAAHLSGATFVLGARPDIETITSVVAREGVTEMLMGAGLVTRMLEHPELDSFDFTSIRRVFFAPSVPAIADQAEKLFGCVVVPLFGAGEGIFMTAGDTAPERARKATCGAPLSELDEVRILEPGTEDEVPFGEIGELTVRGPYTIRGYYRAEERNRDAFTSDGFYRTGDLSRAHLIEGVVYFSHEGRITDNISRGGEKVHAEELETLLLDHPDIAEVAVVGMPDKYLGERVCAFVIPPAGRPAPSVPEVAEFLLARGLAKFKLPERIEQVDEYPRTNVGKISKKELRARIARTLQDEEESAGG